MTQLKTNSSGKVIVGQSTSNIGPSPSGVNRDVTYVKIHIPRHRTTVHASNEEASPVRASMCVRRHMCVTGFTVTPVDSSVHCSADRRQGRGAAVQRGGLRGGARRQLRRARRRRVRNQGAEHSYSHPHSAFSVFSEFRVKCICRCMRAVLWPRSKIFAKCMSTVHSRLSLGAAETSAPW